MEFTTLQDWLLLFVLTPAGSGAILYFILGQAPAIKTWFASLTTEVKEVVVFAGSFLVPLAGMGLAMALSYLPVHEDTIFLTLAVGFAVWSGNQLVRMVRKVSGF